MASPFWRGSKTSATLQTNRVHLLSHVLLSLLSTQCTLGQNNPAPGSVRQTSKFVGGGLKCNVIKFGFFLMKGIKTFVSLQTNNVHVISSWCKLEQQPSLHV